MEYIVRKRSKLLGLPLSFTKYTINDSRITVTRGFLNIEEDYVLMYKVQDIYLKRSYLERLFGLGSIICNTGDKSLPILKLTRIRKSRQIKRYLVTASEEAWKIRREASRKKRELEHPEEYEEF